jgi:hypothetical protein
MSKPDLASWVSCLTAMRDGIGSEKRATSIQHDTTLTPRQPIDEAISRSINK